MALLLQQVARRRRGLPALHQKSGRALPAQVGVAVHAQDAAVRRVVVEEHAVDGDAVVALLERLHGLAELALAGADFAAPPGRSAVMSMKVTTTWRSLAAPRRARGRRCTAARPVPPRPRGRPRRSGRRTRSPEATTRLHRVRPRGPSESRPRSRKCQAGSMAVLPWSWSALSPRSREAAGLERTMLRVRRRGRRRPPTGSRRGSGTCSSLATSSASTCRSRRRHSSREPAAPSATTRRVKPAVSQPRRRIGSSTSLSSTLATTYQSVAGHGSDGRHDRHAAVVDCPRRCPCRPRTAIAAGSSACSQGSTASGPCPCGAAAR